MITDTTLNILENISFEKYFPSYAIQLNWFQFNHMLNNIIFIGSCQVIKHLISNINGMDSTSSSGIDWRQSNNQVPTCVVDYYQLSTSINKSKYNIDFSKA